MGSQGGSSTGFAVPVWKVYIYILVNWNDGDPLAILRKRL